MSEKDGATAGGRKGKQAETVSERNQRWKASDKWRFTTIDKPDGKGGFDAVEFAAETSNPNNIVWMRISDLPPDLFAPLQPSSESEEDPKPSPKPKPAKRAAPESSDSSSSSEASSLENDPPGKGAASSADSSSADSSSADSSSADSSSADSPEPEARVRKPKSGKARAGSSDSKESDNYAKSKRRSAPQPDSGDEQNTREKRKRAPVNYAEDNVPEALLNDDQNILFEKYKALKAAVLEMGMGGTEKEMERKVVRFLLGRREAIEVRSSTVSGNGGFTTRAVATGEVLALLTSQYHARTLRPKGPKFEGMRYKPDEKNYKGPWVNTCCIIHVPSKKRWGLRLCLSNAEFRVLRVRCGTVVLKYVVLLATRAIPKGREIFAYYPVNAPGPPPAPAEAAENADAEDAEDAEDEAPANDGGGGSASAAPRQPLVRFRGRLIKRGSGRAQEGGSERQSEAQDACSSSAARGRHGFARTRGGK